MRPILAVVVPVCIMLTGCSAQPGPKSSDDKKEPKVQKNADPTSTSELDGTWQAARIEAEDGASDNDMASNTRLTIAGEKLKVTLGVANMEGLITTDTTQKPKAFDAKASSKEGAKLDWSGIYEIEGDTLKLCIGEPGARPKEFKSNPATLWVLKRVK